MIKAKGIMEKLDV